MYFNEVENIISENNYEAYNRRENKMAPIMANRATYKHEDKVSKENNDMGLKYFVAKAKDKFKNFDGKIEAKDIKLIRTELSKPNTTDDDSLLDNIINKTIKKKMGLNLNPKYLKTTERLEDGTMSNLNHANKSNIVSMKKIDSLPKAKDENGKEMPGYIDFNSLSAKQKRILRNNMTTELANQVKNNEGKFPKAIEIKHLSNVQKKALVSDLGVSSTKLPNNFYANFNPGSITTNVPSGIGIDGIIKQGNKVYFIERKISDYKSETGRLLTKIIKDINDVSNKNRNFIVTPVINYRSSAGSKEEAVEQQKKMKEYVASRAGRLRYQFHKPDGINELLRSDKSIVNLGYLSSANQKDKAVINEIKLLLKGLVK